MNQHLAQTPGISVATRRQLLAGVAAVAATGLTAATAHPGFATATAVPASSDSSKARNKGGIDHKVINRWAEDTWKSLVAMTDPRTGLPADYIGDSITQPKRSGFTSPTNIGGYLWSTVVARELHLISAKECRDRLTQTLTTLSRLKHHEPSGMLYNWYDEATGEVITIWPENGNVVQPFLSSVDNGWFAAALMVVRNAEPKVAALANSILKRMDFGIFYNKDARPGVAAGLLRGGFYDVKPTVGTVQGNYLGKGPDVYYTLNHYDVTNSEPRIATYIGIALGQIPAAHYFATMRVFPDTCDWSWQEQQPVGKHRTYQGIDVFEGAYTYRGMRIVPSWGGDMFESLMPDLFVPEASWAPKAWGINHPLTVRAQREFGLEDAKYGYWGFSPASHPNGGYSEWGVDALGMSSDGYPSDVERTSVDKGFGECRPAANPTPMWGDGVVTPHASFLAMEYEPREAYDNLVNIERKLGAYGDGGFYDAVAVKSGTIAKRYLSLDQAMVLGAIGNVFGDNVIRRNFVRGEVEKTIKPLIAVEEFGAGLID
ncbi:glucoamylase family protein [Paenarthrobacter sp. NPDC056912]|uniref:glucoamylase family protein n=1 Tax=Paenarthrobacter sp. NPDC056912 TaxID=3345965 RepID=UPI00366FD764